MCISNWVEDGIHVPLIIDFKSIFGSLSLLNKSKRTDENAIGPVRVKTSTFVNKVRIAILTPAQSTQSSYFKALVQEIIKVRKIKENKRISDSQWTQVTHFSA